MNYIMILIICMQAFVLLNGVTGEFNSGSIVIQFPNSINPKIQDSIVITGNENAQGKVSKTDLLWLLPLIKDLVGSNPSQQGRIFMKKNLTLINKKKTMQLVAWPYIDCEQRGISDALKQPEKQRVGIYINIWDSTQNQAGMA